MKRNKLVTLSLLVSIVLFSASVFFSCTKIKSIPANASFIGTWVGTSWCYSSDSPDTTFGIPVTEYIGPGAADNLLNVGESFGDASCYKAVAVEAIVNGYNFSMAPQNFVDNCGNSYLTGGSAHVTVSANTLTMSAYVVVSGVTTN